MNGLEIVITVVSTLLILTALIVVHELGHYFVAKKRGIAVSEFAIGFGPRLIKWHRGETEFSIRPIFIGGFVKFADDMEKEPQPGDFRSASLKSRFLTILAGPVMNVIFALVIAAVILTAFGDSQPVVAEVQPDTPAAEAGLMPGDVIKKWNGVTVDFSYDMQDVADAKNDASVPLVVERDGQKYSYDIPYAEMTDKNGDTVNAIGISYAMEEKSFNFFEALGLSFKWIYMQMKAILVTLGKLIFLGQGVENVAGIVGTAAVVGTAVQSLNGEFILLLIALISVNLAIMNLLPIPALDGGKIIMYIVEGVRRKPAPEKLESALNFIGFALLMGLAVFLVFQDVGRLMG